MGRRCCICAAERDYDELAPRVGRADYRLEAFTNQVGMALAAADLAVSRSGGGVWELAAAGLPALLVPYPHATADHQYKNARHFADGGGAVVVREAELNLRRDVMCILGDAGLLPRMRAAMLELARPNAAETIAEELIALARAGR